MNHVLEKQVRLRVDRGRLVSVLESRDSQDGRGRDLNRSVVKDTVGRAGQAAVDRVVDRRAFGAGADLHAERRLEEPPLDARLGLVDKPQERRAVGPARRRLDLVAHRPRLDHPARVHRQAVGNVRELLGELRGVRLGDGSVRADQREVLAVAVELEVRVQLAAGNRAVLAGSEYDEISAGRERDVRKSPLHRLIGVVRQTPAVERNGRGRGIVDFDPIGGVVVLVGQRAVVDRHELGDQRR